jgi:tripartite ATP-independent transporter DctM subunit
MELIFLAILVFVMATALASGYPVAFALPGSAILTIGLAALCGYVFAGDTSAYFAQGGPIDWLSAGVTNFRGIYWEVERDTLIAIPLFVFMGIMLQRSKIAEDLLITMAQLFGPVPGGLGISVVFVGALLAATTGILGATVVAMGLISLPAMLRNNYSQPLATGTIAASGTLGQIIPPSIVLIILADQLASAVDQASTARQLLYKQSTGNFSMPSEFGVVSTSAGDMFLGALVPGLVLVGLYMLYILVIAILRPSTAPSVSFEGTMGREFFVRVLLTLVPPLALIFVVLGSIITGVATVNQAGAIGAAGAMIMAGYRLREGERRAYWPVTIAILSLLLIFFATSFYSTNIKSAKTSSDVLGITLAAIGVIFFVVSLIWSGWRTYKIDNTLHGVMVETAKTTSLVFIILLGAAMLTAAFRAFGGEELVREFLTNLSGGFWAQFIIVMGVIFILGFFLDFIEIAVVVVPIVAPILLMDPSANITAVWLGVMIGLNIQTSFLTPPFGFALFYLRGVAPAAVKTIEMYKGVIPFIILQLLALVIVGYTPQLVNYLPARMSLLSETSPPPLNPRLQYCIEKYVFEEYRANGSALKTSIKQAQSIDVTALPKKLQRDLKKAFGEAGAVFGHLEKIGQTEKALQSAALPYAPLHTTVRTIQKRIVRIDAKIKEIAQISSRSRGDAEAGLRDDIETEIVALNAERKLLEAKIPANWATERKKFTAVQKTDVDVRRLYRRTVDNAYEPARDTVKILEAGDGFAALEARIKALEPVIGSKPPKEAAEAIKLVAKEVGKVAGARNVRSALNKVRRALLRRIPEVDKAKAAYTKALEMYTEERTWRSSAATDILPKLATYEAAIRETIGLRQQERLPRDQALLVAGCSSGHRDISLSF